MGARTRARQLAFWMCDRLYTDRRQQDRGGQLGAEHRALQAALRHVAQHARHDPPLVEGLAVSPDRMAASSTALDVAARLAREHRVGVALQLPPVQWPRRLASGKHAGGIDLVLVVGEGRIEGHRDWMLFGDEDRRLCDLL